MLTEQDVIKLRQLYSTGEYSYSELRDTYNKRNNTNVSRTTIINCVTGKTFLHLPNAVKNTKKLLIGKVGGRPRTSPKTRATIERLLTKTDMKPSNIIRLLKAKGATLHTRSLYRIISEYLNQ